MVNATLNPFKWCVWGHSASLCTNRTTPCLPCMIFQNSLLPISAALGHTDPAQRRSLSLWQRDHPPWLETYRYKDRHTHPHTDTYSNLNTILHIKCYSVFQVGVGDPANKKSITIRGLNCNFQAFHEKNDGTSRPSLNKRRPPPLTISIYSSYVISENLLHVCDCQRGGGEWGESVH